MRRWVCQGLRIKRAYRHTAPTRIDKTSGEEVANESAAWQGVGNTRRLARRRDHRRISARKREWRKAHGDVAGGSSSVLPDKALKWAQLGMRKLRRWVGRVREVIVRSRMRATTGMPMTLAERASLELCDDDDEFNDAQEHEPMRGSAASLTPLLLQGHFLLARRIEETNGEEPGWKVVRLVNDVVRHREDDQTAPRTRRLTVIEGVSVGNADEQK